jgi:hypothetical protein
MAVVVSVLRLRAMFATVSVIVAMGRARVERVAETPGRAALPACGFRCTLAPAGAL